MAVKNYKPTSPGRRAGTFPDMSEVTGKPTVKGLLTPLRRSGGRNNTGRVTTRFRGGGHKRFLRKLDFKRDKDGVPATVAQVEYDPGRTARIALLHYRDGEKRYILAPLGLQVGATLESGEKVEPVVGNTMPLGNIPLGLFVHNVELHPGSGGQLGRSAGSQIQLLAREGEYATLVLPSGERRKVHARCRATIGQVGNLDHQNQSLGKAGRKRWLGLRPHVRGVAMNPVSHPMGGGEGRSKGGNIPRSPTGVPSKGGKTRHPRKPSSRFIIHGRKKRIETV
ncbi:MAG: 50S ribosomal protein L2 [Planctomycetes bacterium]|nr:50S ribosomal protein L2 [Planctomycetota bacterium]